MTTWRDDPTVKRWDAASNGYSVAAMEVAVAAYKRWLTSEIEKLHGNRHLSWPEVARRVLELVEQEHNRKENDERDR